MVVAAPVTRAIGVTPDQAKSIVAAGRAAHPGHALREVALAEGVAGPVWPEPVTTLFASALGHQHLLLLGVSPRLPLPR